MKILTWAILIFCTTASMAEEGLSLNLAKRQIGMIDLYFKNNFKTNLELKIPVEGSATCEKYFDIEAFQKDGKVARKSILYAPGIEPYVVRLVPKAGLYVHRIQPSAYLNGVEFKKLQKLRVKYTNPLTGKAVLSDWLVLSQERSASPGKK